MFEVVKAFLEDVPLADNIPALEELLKDALDQHDIQHFVCTNMYGLKCMPDRHLIFGSWGTDWVSHYISNGYYAEDAVSFFSNGLEHDGRPYYWSQLIAEKKLTKTQYAIFADAWDADLREGIVFPINISNTEFAMISLGGLHFKKNAVLQGILHTIVLQAHRQARNILLRDYYNEITQKDVIGAFSAPDISKITSTEKTIISLLAEDKRARDIALIQNTSVSTVRKHLSSAKTKLGVDNTEALVATAIRQKLIH